jgi:ribonuclease Z
MADLEAVLLTTFLADDFADLGEVMTRTWIAGRRKRLAVYGPPGTRRVVDGVVDVHRFDVVMRKAHHDPQYLDPEAAPAEAHEFALDGADESAAVLEEDGLRITAFSVGVLEGIPSVGYRFDYAGRSIVIAGHAMHQPNLVAYAKGADVLVHQAVSLPMGRRGLAVLDRLGLRRWSSLVREMLQWHPSATDAAEVARDAGVGVLVLTRLAPVPASWFERWVFTRGVREIFPHTVLGEDGMRMHLVPREPG